MTSRLAFAFATTAALALAACGSKESAEGPKTEEQVKAEVAAMTKMKPGEYESTMKLTKMEIPGLPEAQAKQMQDMMAGQSQKQTYCLTAEQSEKGGEEMFKQLGQGDCKFDKFVTTSDTVDAVMNCKMPGGAGEGKFAMTGTVAEESSEIKMNVEMSGAQFPGGKASMAMEASARRIGDCKS